MGRVFTASTNAITPQDRLRFWNNAGSTLIGGANVAALSETFEAQVRGRAVHDLLVFGLQATPHRVTTKALGIGPGQREVIRLRYQRSGRSTIWRGLNKCELQRGDWIVVDPRAPHVAINEGDAAHIWLEMPCSRLAAFEIAAARSMTTKMQMSGHVSGMLCECIRYSLEDLEELSPSRELDLGGLMVDMFRMALNELPPVSPKRTGKEETEQRVRSYIDRNLHDPELSVEKIAEAIGYTPRYIHKTFEGKESVSRLIWNKRLDLCRERLSRQQIDRTTLTALAFDHGFSNSSHFSRSFRQRFGTSPSAYLSQVRGKSS